MLDLLFRHRREFGVAVASAITFLAVALSDDTVTAQEWCEVALAFLGGLGFTATVPTRIADKR